MTPAALWTSEAELRARVTEVATEESKAWPPAWRALLSLLAPLPAARTSRGRPRDPARARVLGVVVGADPVPPARVLALAALVAGASLNDAWRTLTVGAVIRAEARAAGHAVRAMRQQTKSQFLSVAEGDSNAHSQ